MKNFSIKILSNSITKTPDQDYQAACVLLNQVLWVNQRLPEQVFKEHFFGFICQDFDNAMTADFWNFLLQSLGKALNDRQILMAVLDPDPENYFYQNFGHYNMLNLPIDTTGLQYFQSLATGSVESPADAILYNSEVVVWVSGTGRWAIFGQRSYEVCILAFADEQALVLAKPFLDQTWQIANNALNSFVLKQVNKNFLAVFMHNYLK